ncbi:hypothetical protein FNV43_RR11995 [Rhamnella rubrinervis]|uniref:Uncharacterized protein n=1 Tax=Rhamnella rubrinervis TaxID=2594499 RepID=A0A8K0H6V3_9ROSA|nr:hypothetical protein FNV43_RR11995 [Rhamnella rubrinervis]
MSMEVTSEGGEASQGARDYVEPPPASIFDVAELSIWSFYRAIIAEFIATLLFLYVTVATVIGYNKQADSCETVGVLGIAWAFGGMNFILVYSTAGISGTWSHKSSVTLALFLSRKVSLMRAVAYLAAQCLGAICGAGLMKGIMEDYYNVLGVGSLPIGFAVFVVHLASIPITGTGINPARSFGPAVIFNKEKVCCNLTYITTQWIFWVGPFVGALAAAFYHEHVLGGQAIKVLGSVTTNPA